MQNSNEAQLRKQDDGEEVEIVPKWSCDSSIDAEHDIVSKGAERERKMELKGPENRMSWSGAVSWLNRPLTIRSNKPNNIDWFRI